MENNIAEYAGSDLFGGSVDNCYLVQKVSAINGSFINSSFIFSKVFHFGLPHGLSYISSTPHGVCLCSETNMPDCNSTALNREVFPGEKFEVSAVVIGQKNDTVPGNVFAKFSKHTTGLPSLGLLQKCNTALNSQGSWGVVSMSNSKRYSLILTELLPLVWSTLCFSCMY